MPITPRALKKGDTIGIVTLGSPIKEEIVHRGVKMLQEMGYKILLGEHVFSNNFPASSPTQRASDLMEMFLNPDVSMILPARGGTGVADVLPYLDYKAIQQNPKIISGYSDISVILNSLFQFSNLLTFNGLMLLSFQPSAPAFNFDSFFASVTSAVAPHPILNPPGIPFIGKIPGEVTARVVGGCLTSIAGTLGTPFEIDTKGKILFLEDVHKETTQVYRLLTHLRSAGKLDDCLGFIIGECADCVIEYDATYEKIVDEVLVPFGKPLLTNLRASHGYYNVTIPIGALINLNTINPSITVLEPTVKVNHLQASCYCRY